MSYFLFPISSQKSLFGITALLCLTELALAVDFLVHIKNSFILPFPFMKEHLDYSAGSGRSTHFQSRRQPKRRPNTRFHQTETCICHGSAHVDSFDLDPSKPQSLTKVEWVSASESFDGNSLDFQFPL